MVIVLPFSKPGPVPGTLKPPLWLEANWVGAVKGLNGVEKSYLISVLKVILEIKTASLLGKSRLPKPVTVAALTP
jgi:hypothetical protein